MISIWLAAGTLAAASPPAAETVSTEPASIILPMPGEWFAALQKTGRIQWRGLYRETVGTQFSSRPQIALNLGVLYTDGFLAAQAGDARQAGNVARDLAALAKGLGVGDALTPFVSRIEDAADGDDATGLHVAVESSLRALDEALHNQHDAPLSALVSIGIWLRAMEIVAESVVIDYAPERAALLAQTWVAGILLEELDKLPERVRAHPSHIGLQDHFRDLALMASIPAGETPTPQEVSSIHKAAKSLMRAIEQREEL